MPEPPSGGGPGDHARLATPRSSGRLFRGPARARIHTDRGCATWPGGLAAAGSRTRLEGRSVVLEEAIGGLPAGSGARASRVPRHHRERHVGGIRGLLVGGPDGLDLGALGVDLHELALDRRELGPEQRVVDLAGADELVRALPQLLERRPVLALEDAPLAFEPGAAQRVLHVSREPARVLGKRVQDHLGPPSALSLQDTPVAWAGAGPCARSSRPRAWAGTSACRAVTVAAPTVGQCRAGATPVPGRPASSTSASSSPWRRWSRSPASSWHVSSTPRLTRPRSSTPRSGRSTGPTTLVPRSSSCSSPSGSPTSSGRRAAGRPSGSRSAEPPTRSRWPTPWAARGCGRRLSGSRSA